LRTAIPRWLEETGNGLTERFRRLLGGLWRDLLMLDERVKEMDREIDRIAGRMRRHGPIIRGRCLRMCNPSRVPGDNAS
jgi:hypothetical protein